MPTTKIFKPSELPRLQKPSNLIALTGHDDDISRIVVDHGSRSTATLCVDDKIFRRFKLDDNSSGPLRSTLCFENDCNGDKSGLVCLETDLLASSTGNGEFTTWKTKSDGRLETLKLSFGGDTVIAVEAVKRDMIAVGVQQCRLYIVSRSNVRHLKEVACVLNTRGGSVFDISVSGGKIVCASENQFVSVLSNEEIIQSGDASLTNRVTLPYEHCRTTICAVLNAAFLVTGSCDSFIRVFEAKPGGAEFPLLNCFENLHVKAVTALAFVSETVILGGSDDGFVVFTCLLTRIPVARVKVGFEISTVAIATDGRITCGGDEENATVFEPPPALKEMLKEVFKEFSRNLSLQPGSFLPVAQGSLVASEPSVPSDAVKAEVVEAYR